MDAPPPFFAVNDHDNFCRAGVQFNLITRDDSARTNFGQPPRLSIGFKKQLHVCGVMWPDVRFIDHVDAFR